MRTTELLEEAGITENSIHNMEVLSFLHHGIKKVVLHYKKSPWDYQVIATFNDGFEFTFTGFSWGYSGTGPHGLRRLLELCEDRTTTMQDIANLDIELDHYQIFPK